MKIVMLGAPGAGKGTQAKMIAENYKIPHISTGDMFRLNIKNGTELGMEAKKYMDQGLLVPDELTVRIFLDRVAQDDCKDGYVLDGFPRTIPQAQVLEEALDKLETVEKRLRVYQEQTAPLLEFYKAKGVLRSVDGTQDMQDVFKDITEILK